MVSPRVSSGSISGWDPTRATAFPRTCSEFALRSNPASGPCCARFHRSTRPADGSSIRWPFLSGRLTFIPSCCRRFTRFSGRRECGRRMGSSTLPSVICLIMRKVGKNRSS
uniref:(northern house mosquito) hypothetical protein n=1 Tax=Culex pipiens TaxID=7175 RepID=A0A8D8B2A6_CULPI